MREFFRGWRRKVGCLTLLMACILMWMWCRNFHEPEYITFSPNSHNYSIYLMRGIVVWSEFIPDRCGPIDLCSREVHYYRYFLPLTMASA